MRNRPIPYYSLLIIAGLLWGNIPASGQFSRADFKRLDSLIGTWQMPQPPGMLYEVWEKANDTLLLGRSFSVRGNDTVPQENILLTRDNGAVTYRPTVTGQNDGRPVTFTLKAISDSGFLFENIAHDFPQQIRYRPAGNVLYATISGSTRKGFRTVSYPYARVSKPAPADRMDWFRGRWRLRAWLSAGSPEPGTPPDLNATWFVSSILDGVTSLSGQVQLASGRLFTSELIAFDPAKSLFVRTIAAADSSYYTFTSKGWQGDKLVWLGAQSMPGGSVAMKQEICYKSQDAFTAIFYTQREGKWVQVMREELERIR